MREGARCGAGFSGKALTVTTVRTVTDGRGTAAEARRHRRARGFSLVEVNLAILLVTIGLFTLFALFPMGLRESDMAIVDTQEAMFADHVLGGVKANASAITSWSNWASRAYFTDAVEQGIYPIDDGGGTSLWTCIKVATNFPPTPPSDLHAVVRQLRYRFAVDFDNWPKARTRVTLEVKSGKYGQFRNPQVYATDLFFTGM
jgi:hypothetical protein